MRPVRYNLTYDDGVNRECHKTRELIFYSNDLIDMTLQIFDLLVHNCQTNIFDDLSHC